MEYITIYFCCAILGIAAAAFLAEFSVRFGKIEDIALLAISALVFGDTSHNFLVTMYEFAKTMGMWDVPGLLYSSFRLAICAGFMVTLVIGIRKKEFFRQCRMYYLSITAVSVIWFAVSVYMNRLLIG